MNRKPFNKELYNQYDSAKENVLYFVKKNGLHDARINELDREIDIIDEKSGIAFEVGVKPLQGHNRVLWNRGTFPYNSIDIERRKFDKIHNSPFNVWFVYLNDLRNYAITVQGDTVKEFGVDKVKYVNWRDNQSKKQEELFASINVNKCKIIDLENSNSFWI